MAKYNNGSVSFSPFQWTENVGNGLSLRLPREIIKEGIWSTLKPSSKAVYPCILKFVSKKKGLAFPSLRTLAIVSGVTEKTAGDGIKGLDELPGFEKNRYITNRGHTAYKYQIKEPPPDTDHTIWISHEFINGGNWSLLNPTAKAIFPVLKHFSWWDGREYCDLENLDSSMDYSDLSDLYPSREYDFMDADDEIICELSGITTRSLKEAYRSLSDRYFISSVKVMGRKLWKVHIKPSFIYKREYLNKHMIKRYGGTLQEKTT